MMAIVLAAGFGTRLHSIIGNFPKALIEVRGETLLDRLCDQLENFQEITSIVIVSNALFYPRFSIWLKYRRTDSQKIVLLNNGAKSAEERLGAVGDIAFAIRTFEISEPILVAASDCYFTFDLKGMYDKYIHNGGNWIAVAKENDPLLLVEASVVEIDENSKISYMEEKPKSPRSNLGALPFYIYEASTLKLINDYLSAGGNPDSPGRFPEWLHVRHTISAFIISDIHYCDDLGTPISFANSGASLPD